MQYYYKNSSSDRFNDGQFFLRDPVRVVCLADKHGLLLLLFTIIFISLAITIITSVVTID